MEVMVATDSALAISSVFNPVTKISSSNLYHVLNFHRFSSET